MSIHNIIGFYEERSKNFPLIIIKYYQIRTLSLLLMSSSGHVSMIKDFLRRKMGN